MNKLMGELKGTMPIRKTSVFGAASAVMTAEKRNTKKKSVFAKEKNRSAMRGLRKIHSHNTHALNIHAEEEDAITTVVVV